MHLRSSKEERFARRYVGKGADRYDQSRAGTKWVAENAAFDELYNRVGPQTVLDCPVGTGRFFERYLGSNASVLGVDLSDDMLALAAAKIPAGAAIRLQQADVLDEAQGEFLGRNHDLIVCVRFVYALGKDKLPLLFRQFSTTGSAHLLMNANVWPDATTKSDLLRWYIWNTDSKRPRLRRRWGKYVPSEGVLHGMLEDNGWRIVDRKPVLTDRPIKTYFYLLRNSERNA